ncbi:hypothetical protein [Agrobacterium tumefaciens]|uniref:hypothetical protein n=1 Tax=Agrobacterium tumefaciens TaxID=358 RepID=UPI0022430A56|nr:hypothetical protein [Agrobacterium tumefaciens]MCW8060489.1 hypothetical protein [Agrobacterium tumefaciens]MCW8145933.1 hypothetical protein [Agrobacterium tumefaciens]
MSSVYYPRLLILACSATKRLDPGYMPAIERYNGPLWQTLRTVDPDGSKAMVAFLSARYGFRDARDTIEPYDGRLTEDIASAMKTGGLGTRWPRPKTQRRVMPSGDHPGMHINSLSEGRRKPFADVALVGGSLYLEVMRYFVELFRDRGHVTGNARVTEINGPIGRMRRDLRLWLDEQGGETR